jgi:hypothetical protein
MKINKIAVSTLIVGLSVFASSIALAEEGTIAVKANVGVDLDTSAKVMPPSGASVSASASANAQNKTTATVSSSSQGDENKDNDNKNAVGEAHRSVVAAFVQHLLQVADREGGIGAEVKVIAQAQNDSQKVTNDALVKVQGRGGFKTFFIGADYKNIGTIRSEMVVTANQIAQLKKLIEKTTNTTDKAELQAQVQILEQEQVKIEAFLKAKESTFSLLGWMFH